MVNGTTGFNWALLAGVLLLVAGCAAPAAPTVTPQSPSPTPVPGGGSPVPAEAAAIVALAKRQLAERLGRTEAEIGVSRVEALEWPDSSLGCPQPGMMYAQVITPGYRLLLIVSGTTYEYHGDRGSRAVPCP